MSIELRLKPRITIGILFILLICLMISCILFLNRERQRLENDIEMKGKGLATLVAKFCATPIQKYSFFIVQEVARNVEQSEGVAFCEIYDAEGKSLVEVDVTVHGEKVVKNKRRVNDDILVIETPIEKDDEVIGKVEIGLELAPVRKQIWAYIIRLVIVVTIILVLVGLSINAFLSYNFISPVVNLSGVVKNLARGEFVETRVARRKDEIGDLARAFNVMSNNLKQLYQNLEKKVDARTADLAKSNRQLENEIEVRERVEQDLKKAKESAERANQYKSNFVANMSHEIRTPLNAILGYAQILQARDDLDGQVRKAVEAIDRGGSHLLGLINDILDLSKIEAGRMDLKPSAFDLCLLIRNMSSMFQLRCSEKSLTWQVVGIDPKRTVPVIADAGKVRQILINLLGNAVKFTNKGGVVMRVNIENDDLYKFSIEDTGPGIPEKHRISIFEPFTDISGSTGKEGTGLGLSITNRFLEMMGSKLEVMSNEPRGTRFCFEMTLPKAEISSLPADKHPRKIAGIESDRSLTALIVDDDKLSRAMLTHLLNKTNINTLEAENGLEALKVLKVETPDIIFLDRYMPEMDGAETITNIRRIYGSDAPPIVMITAAAFDSLSETQEQLGVQGIIIKPCNITQVIECMASVLGLSLKLQQETVEDNKTVTDINPLVIHDVALSEDLRDRLITAAEYGKINELKKLLQELQSTAYVSRSFIRLLQKHLDVYELEEILTLLKSTEVRD